MPIIDVTLIEGRSDALKEDLIFALTEATVTAIGAPRQAIRVILREVPPQHFGAGGVSKAKSAKS